MKRIAFIMFLFVCLCICAGAAGPDIAGSYYYTDIKVTLYDAPITSYNIGGQTVIEAEVLNWYYGFEVVWDPTQRTLSINDTSLGVATPSALSGELCSSTQGITGQAAGNYYETDIVTYLDGKEITSYNIGGKTCIVAEQMLSFDYSVIWDGAQRTLSITKSPDCFRVPSDFGVFKTKQAKQRITVLDENNTGAIRTRPIILKKYNEVFTLSLPTGKIYALGSPSVNYITLADLLRLLGATCEIIESPKEITSSQQNSQADYCYSFNIDYDPSGIMQPVNVERPPLDNGTFIYSGEFIQLDATVTLNGLPAAFGDLPCEAQDSDSCISGFIVYKGECMVPVQTVANWLGYVSAN